MIAIVKKNIQFFDNYLNNLLQLQNGTYAPRKIIVYVTKYAYLAKEIGSPVIVIEVIHWAVTAGIVMVSYTIDVGFSSNDPAIQIQLQQVSC